MQEHWQVHESMDRAKCALGSALGMQAHPSPDTVRSLIDSAMGQMTELENQIGMLGERLASVRSMAPPPIGSIEKEHSGDPECIAQLRILLRRILSQQQTVRTIADELRV